MSLTFKNWFYNFFFNISIIKKILNKHPYKYGIYCLNHLDWYNRENIKKIIINFTDGEIVKYKDRHFNLINLLNLVKDLKGDTIEFGVYKGQSSYIICEILKGQRFFHHAVDSFKGLSKPKKKDLSTNRYYVWEKGDLAFEKEKVMSNLKKFDNILFYEGYIPKVLKKIKNSVSFKFAHFDLDLYEPTLFSLKKIYNQIIKGGVILFDDYGFNSCPGVKLAVDEFFKNRKENVVEISSGQAFIIKY